jgi:hypothetical protein
MDGCVREHLPEVFSEADSLRCYHVGGSVCDVHRVARYATKQKMMTPCAAANGGIASLFQSPRLVAAVAELGSLDHITVRTNSPVLGTLSVAFPLIGFVTFVLGSYYAERWSQMRVPFWSLLIGSVGGLLLASSAFARRERLVALPAIGLIVSLAEGVYFVRLFL